MKIEKIPHALQKRASENNEINLVSFYAIAGRLADKDNTEYTYTWTDKSGNSIPEITNPTKGYIGFYTTQSCVLKIKRQKGIFTDVALVDVSVEDCEWDLYLKDNDLPTGSGAREVTSGGTLEVVRTDKKIGVLGILSDADYGEIYWKEEDVSIENTDNKTNIDISTDAQELEKAYSYLVTALNETKSANLKVYDEDRKDEDISDLDISMDDWCTLINDINDRLKGIGIDDQPFSCFVNSEVESFNAEVYGQPTVVRDEQGDVTVGVTGDLPSITIPAGPVDITLTFSIGGGVKFLYDKEARDPDSDPVMPPDEMTGSRICIGLNACAGKGAEIGDYTIVNAKLCGDGAINIDFSETDDCLLKAEVSMDYITGVGEVEVMLLGKYTTDPVPLIKGINPITDFCIIEK